jgi:iron(III) transport system permease protein
LPCPPRGGRVHEIEGGAADPRQPLLFIIAYVTLHLPYAVRICASGIAQLHPELEEAGAMSRARWDKVFLRIVAGMLAPTLLASLLYVGLRSFREYAASLFLATPGTEVFSVLVLDMADTGHFSMLSAYVTLVLAVLAVIVGAFAFVAAELACSRHKRDHPGARIERRARHSLISIHQ